MSTKPTVTIINNEPTFRWTVSRLLERHGFSVATHERNTAAVEKVRETGSIAVIIEASSGSAVTATWIVERLRNTPSTRYVPIVVCSPDGRFLHSYGEYLRGQGCVVIGRPYNDEQLVELVQTVASVGRSSATPAYDEAMLAG